jgi:IS1 family transposase
LRWSKEEHKNLGHGANRLNCMSLQKKSYGTQAKHCTWYAMDKRSGIILAWHNGGRTDVDFLKLYSYLALLPKFEFQNTFKEAFPRNNLLFKR